MDDTDSMSRGEARERAVAWLERAIEKRAALNAATGACTSIKLPMKDAQRILAALKAQSL